MPIPPEVDALSSHLADTYRAALEEVRRQAEAVAAGLDENPRLWRQQRRLREVEAAIEATLDRVDEQAADFLARRFPETYGAGAVDARASIERYRPVAAFTWTAPHLDAVAILTDDLMTDLLKSTRYIRRQVKTELRRIVRSKALAKVTTGQTAVQAGREAAAALRDARIGTVRYVNGARVSVDHYAEMAMRTKTAVAYNAGTVNFSTASGVQWFEVFDGSDCGWIEHADIDKANGSIRSADECASASISHPNCRRSFGPRPDITNAAEAKAGLPSTTEAQRADQAAAERVRADLVARRAQGRTTKAAAARQRAATGAPRATRAARARQRAAGTTGT